MNKEDFTAMRISKSDYFKLPDTMRQMSDGPMVLTMRAGRQTFVRVTILEG